MYFFSVSERLRTFITFIGLMNNLNFRDLSLTISPSIIYLSSLILFYFCSRSSLWHYGVAYKLVILILSNSLAHSLLALLFLLSLLSRLLLSVLVLLEW